MALWEKTQKLSGAQLKDLQSIYGEHFPLELRDYLAPWIELQPWWVLNKENDTCLVLYVHRVIHNTGTILKSSLFQVLNQLH